MFDLKNSAALIQHPVSAKTPLKHPGGNPVMEQEKFCPCKDPSLPFPGGILPHQRICQVNRDFPPNEVCQGREFRRGSLPSQLSLEQPSAEVKGPCPRAVRRKAEQVRLDRTAVAAAGIAGAGLPNKLQRVEGDVAAALQRMMQQRKR
jgi:hypothetical protein